MCFTTVAVVAPLLHCCNSPAFSAGELTAPLLGMRPNQQSVVPDDQSQQQPSTQTALVAPNVCPLSTDASPWPELTQTWPYFLLQHLRSLLAGCCPSPVPWLPIIWFSVSSLILKSCSSLTHPSSRFLPRPPPLHPWLMPRAAAEGMAAGATAAPRAAAQLEARA
jgi:hypothetical protein